VQCRQPAAVYVYITVATEGPACTRATIGVGITDPMADASKLNVDLGQVRLPLSQLNHDRKRAPYLIVILNH